MGIVDEDISRVREQSDIVAVISQYTQLKRVGRRFTGLCPFHSERSPSFSVNAEEGLYYCFGCGASGDTITFVREKEQLDFRGAVEWLGNKFGISIRYTDEGEGEEHRRRGYLQSLIGRAVGFYHDRLLHHADAGRARSYLRQRGYDGDIVRHYQIGWAPEGWDHLSRALRLSDEDWKASGLGGINARGRQYDFFRGRVLFPIFGAQGEPLGFGGRVLPGSGDNRKYVNSGESAIYNKSRVLYGLNWVKGDVVHADEVIVCEGYTDVIGFAQAGVPRAVATCGTALTEDHVKLLRRFARRVVLSFDADSAGQQAAARFYEWEQAHDLEVLVADLPDGVDPADLAREEPAALAAAIEQARPFLQFRVERVLDAGNMASPEGRARTAEAAVELVAQHPDRLVRDQYAYTIADRCRISEDLVRDMVARGPRRTGGSEPPTRGEDRQGPAKAAARAPLHIRHPAEYEALKLLVHRHDDALGFIVGDLLSNETLATAFAHVTAHDEIRDAIDAAGPEVGEVIARISVEEVTSDPLDVACLLWRQFLEHQIELGRRSARGAVTPADIAEINAQLNWLVQHHEALLDPARRAPTVASLLAWIGHGPEEVR